MVTIHKKLGKSATLTKLVKNTTFSLVPLGDRVVILPAEKEGEKTRASGIIIPDTVDKEKSAQGKIIAVGRGKYDDGKLIPMQVKVGDTVFFSKYGYEEVKVDGQEYYLIAEANILCVLV